MVNEKENLRKLNKRIKDIKIKGKPIIIFDFDELVVPTHLTRTITQKISKPIDKIKLKRLNSCSFEGIKYLNNLMAGYDFKAYEKIRNKIAKGTNWREGSEKLIKQLMRKFTVIFVSSGMKDICKVKLNEIKFKKTNIIGGEFKIKNGKIKGANLIISDKLKGYVIDMLDKKGKTIAIGHSLGDKPMLDHADISISFNSNISKLAQFNVKSPKEILKIINKELA